MPQPDKKHLGQLRAESPLPGGVMRDYDLLEVMRPDDPQNPEAGGTTFSGTWGELNADISAQSSEFVDTTEVNNLNSLFSPGAFRVNTQAAIGLPAAISRGGALLVMEANNGTWQQYLTTAAGAPTLYHRRHDGTAWGAWYKASSTVIPYD